jgi:hypothetical protein
MKNISKFGCFVKALLLDIDAILGMLMTNLDFSRCCEFCLVCL